MELLGSYKGSLTTEYYSQLLILLNEAISAGDLSGGSAFDQTSVLALEAQAQSFAVTPTGSAGTRVTDDSFNYPLGLLLARIKSMQAEAANFTTISGRLLDVLHNETVLLDEILAGASLAFWDSTLAQLTGAWSHGWNFNIGQGPKSEDLINLDPINLVVYDRELPTVSVFDCVTEALVAGLSAPEIVRKFPIQDASWHYVTSGIPQELYAPDMTWAQLDLLETLPRVDFSPAPNAEVIFPTGGFSVSGILDFTGQVPGGALPTYVRIIFYPRMNSMSTTVTNGVATVLSSYAIDPNSVIILAADGSQVYSPTIDFNANPIGTTTPIVIGTNVPVLIYFTEYWPAYQCSMDQSNWSDIIMLDPDRPYRDDETKFLPVGIKNDTFPVTDETGDPTGIYFKPLVLLTKQYTVLVTTPALGSIGPTALLWLDVEQPSFLNSVNLSPYAAFPVTLLAVEVEGLTSNTRNTVFSGEFLMEDAVRIRFPRQIVSKVYLTFRQESYTIKEYQVDSPDALRRNTMNSLQSSLPFAMRGAPPAVPLIYRGYQYEFGFEDIVALDVQPSLPGVFVQGPLHVPGAPDVLRLEAQTSGAVDVYVCYRAFDLAGTVVDENLQGLVVVPGTAIVFPFASLLDRSIVASTDISVRFVLRSEDAVVSRYFIQTTLR